MAKICRNSSQKGRILTHRLVFEVFEKAQNLWEILWNFSQNLIYFYRNSQNLA
ncbi:hypothetical protein [Helicobacter sp. 23-1045]